MSNSNLKLMRIDEAYAKAILAEQRQTKAKVFADQFASKELTLKIYGKHVFVVHKDAKSLVEFDEFWTTEPNDATNTYLRAGKWSPEHKTHLRNVGREPIPNTVLDLIKAAKSEFKMLSQAFAPTYGAQAIIATAKTPESIGATIAELRDLADQYELHFVDASDNMEDATDRAQLHKFIVGNPAKHISCFTIYVRKM